MCNTRTTHHLSIELIERFAEYLLKDCKSKDDLATVEELGSYIMYFSNEIDMNNKRNQIFQKTLENIDLATEKPDFDSVLSHFNKEIEETKMQLNKALECEKYINFMKMISEKNLECDSNNDSHNEIQTVSETVNTLDPISKLPITDPVKNKKCGHTYEKSTILQFIRRNPKTRCPIAGCEAAGFIKKDDLVPDTAMKRILSTIDNNAQKKLRPL